MATRQSAAEIDAKGRRNRKAWGKMAEPAAATRHGAARKPRKASQAPIPTESQVLRACLELLQRSNKVAFAFRANAGAMQNTRGQWVKFGFRGMPDIIGMLKGGRFLACEIKRPGKVPNAEQNVFLYRVNIAGGFGCWVDGVDRLEFLLRNAA